MRPLNRRHRRLAVTLAVLALCVVASLMVVRPRATLAWRSRPACMGSTPTEYWVQLLVLGEPAGPAFLTGLTGLTSYGRFEGGKLSGPWYTRGCDGSAIVEVYDGEDVIAAEQAREGRLESLWRKAAHPEGALYCDYKAHRAASSTVYRADTVTLGRYHPEDDPSELRRPRIVLRSVPTSMVLGASRRMEEAGDVYLLHTEAGVVDVVNRVSPRGRFSVTEAESRARLVEDLSLLTENGRQARLHVVTTAPLAAEVSEALDTLARETGLEAPTVHLAQAVEKGALPHPGCPSDAFEPPEPGGLGGLLDWVGREGGWWALGLIRAAGR